jgi:hypothetical protein
MKRKDSSKAPVLGVDIGRVIIEGDGPDTNFIGGTDERAMQAPAMAGCFEALQRLTQLFDRRVWLVSKCGPRIQERSRKWLDRHRFFQTTGIPYGQLRFCRERKEKAPICVDLGVTMFIDDRLDVLHAMAGVVPYRFQFGASEAPDGIVPVRNWVEAEEAVQAASESVTDSMGH